MEPRVTINPTQGTTLRHKSSSHQLEWPHESVIHLTQLEGPHRDVAVHNPNLSTPPPQGGSPSPKIEGPHRSVAVHYPRSRGHTEAWESITPTRGAKTKRGIP